MISIPKAFEIDIENEATLVNDAVDFREADEKGLEIENLL